MASGGGSHAAAKLKEGDKLVAEAEKRYIGRECDTLCPDCLYVYV